MFWKLDRLTRSLADVLALSDRLTRSGVEIVSIQEGIDAGTATGRLYRNILGTLAEFERETITERIKEALAERARQGEMLGPLPVGYCRAEDGTVLLHNAAAVFVRAAYERYSTGRYSLRDLAAWAREQRGSGESDLALDRLGMRKLLQNISYTGVVSYHRRRGNGTLTPGKHPAIVSTELFDTVQRVLRQRRRAPDAKRRPWGKLRYPLSGITRCGACGAPMGGSSSGHTRYLRCSTAARLGRSACGQTMIRADVLEGQMASFLSRCEIEQVAIDHVLLPPASVDDFRENFDLGRIFLATDPQRQRELVHEIFSELRIDGQRLIATGLRGPYAHLSQILLSQDGATPPDVRGG